MPGIVAVLALVVLALNAPASAAGRIPPEPPANRVPVTICHDVNGNGNTGNGYNIITVDASSIVRQGHTSHGGGLVDIIPPFTYFTLEGTGQNRVWVEHFFPGQGDVSLIDDNCGSSGPPTEECPDGDFNGPDEAGCGVPPEDVCPNIDGVQSEVPPGMEVDENGDCVVVAPPEDVCPDIPGDQTDPAECPDRGPGGGNPPGSGGAPSPGVTVAGEQASAGTAGAPGSSNAPAVPTDVAAGLAPATAGSGEALLALGLVGFGFVLMTCAGLLGLRDRRRGSYRA